MFRRQQVVSILGHLAHERSLLERAYNFNVSRLIEINQLIRDCEGESQGTTLGIVSPIDS